MENSNQHIVTMTVQLIVNNYVKLNINVFVILMNVQKKGIIMKSKLRIIMKNSKILTLKKIKYYEENYYILKFILI